MSIARGLTIGAGVVAVVLLSGCGGGTVRTEPYSFKHVESVFASRGFRPMVAFDAANASDRQIDRIAARESRVPRITSLMRAGLHRLRDRHTSELVYPSPSGAILLLVAPTPAAAATYAANLRRQQARERARAEALVKKWRKQGETVTGGGFFPVRVSVRGNVMCMYPGTKKAPVMRRAQAALAAL